MRDVFAHVEAAHAVAVAATAAVAITAAVVLSTPGAGAHQARLVPVQASGGRVAPVAAAPPRARALRRRTAVGAPISRSTTPNRPLPGSPLRRKTPCIYDPSTYDC